MSLRWLIFAGGVCQLGILLASALVPRVLRWGTELRQLTPLCRHVVWTHGAFIVLVIVGLGAVSVGLPGELAAGTPLARCVCGFIGIFWGARLVIQLFLFDARPYLTTGFLKAGYHGLTGVFAYLAAVYLMAATGV
jgi:hypothetical protein